MSILVILAHPNPGSFNHAIAHTAAKTLEERGHDILFHDLYAEGFDPITTGEEIPASAPLLPSIARHCQELANADGVVIVHPNWWGGSPAILKGWVDRVVRPGVTYRFVEGDAGDGIPLGLLRAQAAVIFTTSNTPRERELRVFGDPLDTFWRNCVFGLCGVTEVRRRNFEVVVTSTIEQRAAWLQEVRQSVTLLFGV